MSRALLTWRERAALKRWLRSLDDRELARVVRGLTALDRAVEQFHEKDTDPPVWRRAS